MSPLEDPLASSAVTARGSPGVVRPAPVSESYVRPLLLPLALGAALAAYGLWAPVRVEPALFATLVGSGGLIAHWARAEVPMEEMPIVLRGSKGR